MKSVSAPTEIPRTEAGDSDDESGEENSNTLIVTTTTADTETKSVKSTDDGDFKVRYKNTQDDYSDLSKL